MDALRNLILVVFLLLALILILLILIQSGKGGSVGILGGGSSSSPFGTSTVDIVTKMTWWLAGSFFSLAILAAVFFAEGGPDKRFSDSEKEEIDVFDKPEIKKTQ